MRSLTLTATASPRPSTHVAEAKKRRLHLFQYAMERVACLSGRPGYRDS
jgi:hypothetical protein